MATLIIKEAAHGPAALHITRATQLAQYIADPAKCTALDRHEIHADGLRDAAREMAAICDAADGTGRRKLIQHWILSTKREGEEAHPDNDTIMAAGHALMAALGYGQCPYMIAIHSNTDNRHAHIIAARVDAETGQIVRDNYTHTKAQRAIADISARHGWRPERGNMYQIAPDGEITTRAKAEASKPRRGNIRTQTAPDDTITPPTPRQTLEDTLAQFVADTRGQWGAWKWGDLHRALALRGVEMQYTEHGDGRGGLAYSADGQTWIKAASACPDMTYPAISAALGAKAGSYRKARKGIAQIAADARAMRAAADPATPPPSTAPEDTPAADARSDAPAGARSAQDAKRPPNAKQDTGETQAKTEAKTMTQQERIQFMMRYQYALEHADEQTKATLTALQQDALFTGDKQAAYAAQIAPHLAAISTSKGEDTDAYARLRIDAARYHARLIIADARRAERSLEERQRNAAQCAAHIGEAKQYATDPKMQGRIVIQQMRMAGYSQRRIAHTLHDGEGEMSDAMRAIIELSEICADMLSDSFVRAANWRTDMDTPLNRRIAAINARYDQCIVPKEYQEEMEEERQAALLAATSLDRWHRRTNSLRTDEQRGAIIAQHDPRIGALLADIMARPGTYKKQVYETIKEEMERITDGIAQGLPRSKYRDDYEAITDKLARYKTIQAIGTDRPTGIDATIYARHAQQAVRTYADPEQAKQMIVLRLRGTGHADGDAARILMAGGATKEEAAQLVAKIYHTDEGDQALQRAAKYADTWRREERGQQRTAAQAAARPAAQTAQPAPRPDRPRM